MKWHYACDEILSFTGATGDGAPLNSATITYAVYAGDGTAVVGGSGTLTYIAASAGNYSAEIDAAVTGVMVVGDPYYVVIVLVSGAFKDTRRVPINVDYRAET